MIVLSFFEILVEMMLNMWLQLSNLHLFSFVNGLGVEVKVSFAAIMVAFSLMMIIWWRFFRSN